MACFGGIIGAMRIPEKFFPGRFDYFLNSHNIMHVLVVYAVAHMHYAAKLDMVWLNDPQCFIYTSLQNSSRTNELWFFNNNLFPIDPATPFRAILGFINSQF